jgi:hypothetical protein
LAIVFGHPGSSSQLFGSSFHTVSRSVPVPRVPTATIASGVYFSAEITLVDGPLVGGLNRHFSAPAPAAATLSSASSSAVRPSSSSTTTENLRAGPLSFAESASHT